MNRKSLLLPLAGVALLAACSSRPDYVLSERKMADVLADLTVADQLALRSTRGDGAFADDSARKVLRQGIMQKNGVSEAEFDSTLAWYGHHLDDYSKLYKAVEKRLADKQARLNKQAGVRTDNANNLWPLPQMLSFSRHDLNPGFSFSLPGDKLKAGHTLVWTMRLTGFSGNATALLGAEYPDQELLYTRQSMHGSGSQRIQLELPADRHPVRVIGYLHFATMPMQRVFVDSLTLEVTKPVPGAPAPLTIPPMR